MSLTIAFPGLIWPDSGDIEYLYQDLKTPFLDKFIKQAKISKHSYSYSDFLCGIHSLERTMDSHAKNCHPRADGDLLHKTLSHKLAKQLNVAREFPYFLVAEPTHLRIDRDRLLISEASLLQLDKTESQAIIDIINTHFTPLFKLYYVNEHLWLLGLNINPEHEKFYPILDIIGENINDYLPKSNNSLKYNKFLNEVQMLLFSTEVNKLRKSEGSLSVSSLWLWDKNISNNTFDYDEVFINDNCPLLNYDKIQALPNNLEQTFCSNKNSLIIIDNLYYPSSYRDSYSWQDKIEDIDKTIFMLLDKMKIKDFTVLILGSNHTLELKIKKRLFLNLFSKNNLMNLARIWHAS